MTAVETISSKDDLYNRFMNKYPYALSNVVIASILMFSFVTGFLFLEETHPRMRKKKDFGLEIGDFILRRLGFDVPVRPWNKNRISHVPQEQEPLITEEEEEVSSLGSDSDLIDNHSATVTDPQPFYRSTDNGSEVDNEHSDSDAETYTNQFQEDTLMLLLDAILQRNWVQCCHVPLLQTQ